MDEPKPHLPEKKIFEMPAEEDRTLEDIEKLGRMNLKESINNFLFKWVPPTMTIAEFEKMAVALYVTIEEEWTTRDVQELGDEG